MIHQTAGPLHLAVLRIAVFGVWFVILLGFDAQLFASLPSELLDLHVFSGGLRLLTSVAGLLPIVKVAALIGCVLTVLGVRPHGAVAGATAVLIFTLDAAMKSVGSYANHAQTLVLLLALLIPLFPAADALSIHRRAATPRSAWLYRAPLMAAATFVTATYAFIGARRLFVGGVSVYTDGSMLRWVVARTLEESVFDVSVGLRILDYPWFLVLLAVGMLVTTVFEILSPVALVRRRFRWMWLAVIASFHFSTLFLMNIFFWENLILLVALFTPLPDRLFERIRRPQAAPGTPSP